MTLNAITLTKPDDFHLHCREGVYLSRTVKDTARYFARALIMPNLRQPIVTRAQALDYRRDILAACDADQPFEPLMSLYLTPQTTAAILTEAFEIHQDRWLCAAKLYPAGATTHSEAGFSNLTAADGLFKVLERAQAILCIHGETVHSQVDVFDRETDFIQKQLKPLLQRHKKLKIVLEHISTQEAVACVKAHYPRMAATITAHHLWLNRNDLLADGIKPHFYCKPIVKTRADQEALIEAAISGHPGFFLGTDSAPHPRSEKESASGCAGVYTAFSALPLYAQIFSEHGALDKLPAFASQFGADFYGLPPNQATLRLVEKPLPIPKQLAFGDSYLTPFGAGETLTWNIDTHE